MNRPRIAVVLLVCLLAGACTYRPALSRGIRDPAVSVSPSPDYTSACSPSGRDTSLSCIQVELQAIDNARAREHVAPMVLPANFDKLGDAQQLFIAVNRERVDRGLAPVPALSNPLNTIAQQAASQARAPANPGPPYAHWGAEWLSAVVNALEADFVWFYASGPGSDGCAKAGGAGCWVVRHLLLGDLAGSGALVMGAALNPTADTTPGDVGGTSLALIVARTAQPESLDFTWAQAQAHNAAGSIRPRSAPPSDSSATHIADPPRTVPATPDFTQTCAPAGLDTTLGCVQAVLRAVNNARAKEGVKAMVLPAGYERLSVPQQIFVAVNLERVDRGLRPFTGLIDELNRNAQKGADNANDPPDAGPAYTLVDSEWAGGSSNGLDADYGWMYDDGIGSGNLDCPAKGGPGCWGHRHGILDDFGTVGTMVMGAALNPTADTGADSGGPSMAATLAVTTDPVGPLAYAWPPTTAP